MGRRARRGFMMVNTVLELAGLVDSSLGMLMLPPAA